MSDDDSQNAIASYLANHPKLLGGLFLVVLLLSQAGAAAAGSSTVGT